MDLLLVEVMICTSAIDAIQMQTAMQIFATLIDVKGI
jgi:hypothetical protein